MLMSLTVRGHWAKRVHRRVIHFTFERGVTLLIGPNGSGKSTVLECLRSDMLAKDGPRKKADRASEWLIKGQPLKVMNIDFEQDNPRVNKGGIMDLADIVRMQRHFTTRGMSHGEVTRKILAEFDTKLESDTGYFVMFDEPEQALDLGGLRLLHQYLVKKRKKWHQMLISTHHPFLIAEPRFNIIEMVPGYRKEVLKALYEASTRSTQGRR